MKWRKAMVFIGAAAVLLCGCQGPETRVLPRQVTGRKQPYELTDSGPVPEEANPFYLQEVLEFLSSCPRVCGSAEETNAAEYVKRLLSDYGYDVTIQRFLSDVAGSDLSYGTNVVAVKKTEETDSDILLVTANHDTAADSPGACDNASGVAVLLETARLVPVAQTDTEIRFISFSGMASGEHEGIRDYLEKLTRQERNRIIGAVHLESLGYYFDDKVVLGTIDGEATLLGDLIAESAKNQRNQQWNYRADNQCGYWLFDHFRIPAVRITQSMTAFEKDSPQDQAGIVDAERLADISEILSRAFMQIIRADTPSYQKASREGAYFRESSFVSVLDLVPEQREEYELARFSLSWDDGADPVSDILAEEDLPVRHKAAVELMAQMIRKEERVLISEIVLVTDGIGGRTVYWQDDRTLSIDLEDLTDREGNYRDYTASCKQFIEAYAYFFKEAYAGLFYQGIDKTNEDEFGSAFAHFVLTGQPDKDLQGADAEILFFYQYGELVTIRGDIRGRVGLPQ